MANQRVSISWRSWRISWIRRYSSCSKRNSSKEHSWKIQTFDGVHRLVHFRDRPSFYYFFFVANVNDDSFHLLLTQLFSNIILSFPSPLFLCSSISSVFVRIHYGGATTYGYVSRLQRELLCRMQKSCKCIHPSKTNLYIYIYINSFHGIEYKPSGFINCPPLEHSIRVTNEWMKGTCFYFLIWLFESIQLTNDPLRSF